MEPRPHSEVFDGQLIRVGQFEDCYIELYSLQSTKPKPNQFMEYLTELRDGHRKLGYRFWYKDDLIFEGRDFSIPKREVSGRYSNRKQRRRMRWSEALISLLGFLCLRPGDTDSQYFEEYTPRQMEFADEESDDLRLLVFDLNEMQDTAGDDPMPDWACKNWLEDEHDWVFCNTCRTNWWKHQDE
jgi:hypothetical protein